jgi:Flp pilus assembly protein TadD
MSEFPGNSQAKAHWERGKEWLKADDMAQACAEFQKTVELVPDFGPGWSNLGATLGELDRTEDALAAFQRALAIDPGSQQTVNNIGVVQRELGRLAESEASFRRVIELSPELAFGYYNLGHTLFLQGRFQAALTAYAQGQSRDPERNPVQASRLALCKVATGDGDGALRDLQQATSHLPAEYRQQLLADTSAVLWALVTQQPQLTGWKAVHEWLSGELG